MEYFDIQFMNLTEDDIAIKKAAHKFAEEVMRPTAKELDNMSAADVVADGSPLWPFLKKAFELGYHKTLLPEYYGGLGLSPLQVHIVFEELGWGSFGLSVLLGVICFPFYVSCLAGNEELLEKYVKPFCACTDASIRGCWAITEPDHGSDYIASGEDYFTTPKMRGNVQARLEGDEYVINGQKSAWVSGGTIATHALLFLQLDPKHGFGGNGICVLPLDLDGVTRGKPLEKIGQRDLNQGEIYFDNVRIPKSYMLAEPTFYEPLLEMILAAANMCMATWSTGIARAAFEEALVYSKERVQGTRPLIEHYVHKQRVFKLFARTEVIRALSRNVLNLNLNVSPPLAEYSLVAKSQCTEMAFQNAHELIQIMGGNGLTKEYIAEKLFRDARATLIEDGNNETLERHGGHILAETYPRPPLDF
ncbi:MAG: acyl-CoA dehydrogenase [Deltaproteobacteria bacterium HGW-Deltaproteobacteria-2]|jgi:alkylation response protein AidB-like acyl-CoA dehydrogenase|nr:MAG: acyl-CoA dehydrogenase [Deltaproteobacteria bacterium HGW-Deltaproteobacteria-2]